MPKKTPNKITKHQKNRETQTQETPTPNLKIFISFEPKNITFTSCVPDLRPFSLDHFRKPNSPWGKKKKDGLFHLLNGLLWGKKNPKTLSKYV